MIRVILFSILSLVLLSCSSSSERLGRKNVQVGDITITWVNIAKIGAVDIAESLRENEGAYMFSRSLRKDVVLSDGKVITTDFCGNGLSASQMLECEEKFRIQGLQAQKQISFSRFLKLSELAVKQEGSCQWLGYDRGFDLRIRASGGGLARFSDERLFFAKLSCNS